MSPAWGLPSHLKYMPFVRAALMRRERSPHSQNDITMHNASPDDGDVWYVIQLLSDYECRQKRLRSPLTSLEGVDETDNIWVRQPEVGRGMVLGDFAE